MEAGTIASWAVKEGESFAAGQVIAEIETDKATMGFEAQDPGVIAKILVQAGSEVNTYVVMDGGGPTSPKLFSMHAHNINCRGALFIYYLSRSDFCRYSNYGYG